MDKIRVAQIVCTTAFGGPDSLVLSLFRGLPRERFVSSLIFLENRRTLNRLLVKKAEELGLATLTLEMRGKFNPGVLKKLVAFGKENRIDIFHSHGYKPDLLTFFAARFFPVRLVSTLHGWVERSPRHRLYKRLDLAVVKKFDHLIAVSHPIERQLLAAGIDAGRVSLIPNSVEMEESVGEGKEESEPLDKLGLSATGPLIGMVGRLDGEKNPGLLLESLPRLREEFPDLSCVFLGEGELRTELIRRAAELKIGSAAIFPGYRRDVRAIIPRLDVVVFPSHREGIPIALLEAMALRRAVVSTAVGGIPDVIEDGVNGLLIPSGDSAALVRSVSKLLKYQSLRRRLGEAAAALIEREYTAGRMVSRVGAVYEKVIID